MPYWIRRFELPSVRSQGFSEGWAIIVIDSKGLLSVYSDFGNYVYHWTSFGQDFVKFLLQLDDCYLSRKLGHPTDVYDPEATLAAVKKGIREAVKEKRLSAADAKEERARLKLCDNLYSFESFGEWVRDSKIEYSYEFARQMMCPQLQGFLTNIWPRFKEVLRENNPMTPPALSRLSRKHPIRRRAPDLLVRSTSVG